MNQFETDWLDLREPADRRARNGVIAARLAGRFKEADGLVVVDLGCGTGSTARAIAGLLPGPQRWRLVDHDEGHLARARAALSGLTDRDGRAIALETCRADLSAGVPAELLDGCGLIATSAFFDLVSRGFLERLAATAAARGLPLYAALTVDGRLACEPPDPLDRAVFDAFNAHMGRDKGFGPACGPRAPDTALHVLRQRGFRVEAGRSDWTIGADEPEFATRLLDGWTAAAAETGLVDPAELARWSRRRHAEIAAGTARFEVGHLDILALPD
ncbi:class I SAM-dependent methyltransferase [Prosthecomicrobium hirschii]|uniref:class I SAM-dependent methyltransferase n=1 Tax=Prosthecodimorpha hirschii TaxID=665126 RepID=UPI002220EAE7|nr:class I SAM-dependent methyltransferase [Prosthecomicrobium hirschii]MCW1839820.1 hypothetical protein [Prosthecomicrobium hirschii]